LPESSWQQITTELSGTHLPEIAPEVSAVQPIIQARQVEKVFMRAQGARIPVIAPTTLSIEPGVIIALLGPSGSGNSTLLRILSGIAQPSAGEVLWHGKRLNGPSPDAAIVFQSFALFPWLTVIENVEVPLIARGMTHPERHE